MSAVSRPQPRNLAQSIPARGEAARLQAQNAATSPGYYHFCPNQYSLTTIQQSERQSRFVSGVTRCSHRNLHEPVDQAGNNKSATVYLLADHLDAVLAAGEDLLKVHRTVFAEVPKRRPHNVRDLVDIQRRWLDAVRVLEMTLTLRCLQARERADELRRSDDRVDGIASLFIGGTAPLADAAAELGDWTEIDFQTGDEIAEYLRSRGLIPIDSEGVVSPERLVVTANFRIARRIELGPLLDLTAAFLDALELFYELYDEDELEERAAKSDEEGTLPTRPVI